MTMTTAQEISEALDLSLVELTGIFRHAAGRELRATAREIERWDNDPATLSLDLVERLAMLVEVFEGASAEEIEYEIGGDNVHPSMEATRSVGDKASVAPLPPPLDIEPSVTEAVSQ